jgi:hypothetical protein
MFSFLSTQTSSTGLPVIEEKKGQNSDSCSERIREGEIKISALKSLATTSLKQKLLKAKPSKGTLARLPPRIMTTPAHSHTFRFVSTSATAAVCTVNHMFGICGNICTVANTTVQSISSSIRIHSVTVYPSAGGDSSFSWSKGTDEYEPDQVMDCSIPGGITVTEPSRYQPPSGALAGFWHNNLGSPHALFSIASSVGSIVDIHISYRQTNFDAALTSAVATGTLGAAYYLALDGTTSHTYTPIGVPSTF